MTLLRRTDVKNTIAAQHFLSTHLSPDWINKPWDELSELDQTEMQALSDCGNRQFQYLRAYKIFEDATLTPTKKMEMLDALETEAGHDFSHVLKFDALNKPEAELSTEDAIQNWTTYIETAATLPLSRRLAFMPIECSADSSNWPKAYKTALYNIAQQHSPDISDESSQLDLLKALTEHFKIAEIAKLYFSEFPVLNPETGALYNEEKITEINRVAIIIPEARRMLATAIATLPIDNSDSIFHNQITLGYHKKTPDDRRQALYELSDSGEREATKYLAMAYRDALLTEKLTPDELVNAGIATSTVCETVCETVTYEEGTSSDNTSLEEAVNIEDLKLSADPAAAIGYSASTQDIPKLVKHLGIPIRSSLSEEERTFGNIAELHKQNTIALIRLAFNLDDTAQTSLFAKPDNQSFSILEKLFDDRMALSGPNDLGPTPWGSDQKTMNRMLTDLLQYGFHVANTLKESHSIPDFFHEQVQAYLFPAANA